MNECDDAYYQAGEDGSGRLFAFIKSSRTNMRL
jgi:hypothetical protein